MLSTVHQPLSPQEENMFAWLRKLAPVRVWCSRLEGRIEVIEQRQADLADRFTRFQNREGMRKAREVLNSTTSVEAEAADLLSKLPVAELPSIELRKLSPKKVELLRKAALLRR